MRSLTRFSIPHRLIWPAITLAGGALFSTQIALMADRDERERHSILFEKRVDALRERLYERMSEQSRVLMGCRGLFETGLPVGRTEWNRYAARLALHEHPGALGYGFVRRVTRDGIPAFLEKTRADGAPDFKIKQGDASGDLYVIEYIEPLPPNRPAQGLNLAFESRRRLSLRESIDRDAATLSRPISLVQDDRRVAGFILSLPLFLKNRPLDTVENRSEALYGWVYTPLRIDELLNGFSEQLEGQVDWTLDDDSDKDALPIYRSNLKTKPGETAGPLTRRFTLPVCGRAWRLRCDPSEAFLAENPREAAAFAMTLGAVLTGMLSVLVWALLRTRERAAALAADMTRDLNARTVELETMNRELGAAREHAESANRAKSAFLAAMSHELRTPLNAILGYAQLLERDSELGGEKRAWVGTINRSGEHLLAIINDILEMSKIEAGRTTCNESVFDLRRLIDGVVELFSVRAAEKHIDLTLDCPADFPRFVTGDEAKLRQVLTNLICNAVKFTAQGSVAVTARRIPATGDNLSLEFAVKDTGPGIAVTELPKLFKPFVQSTAGNSAGGTGLGLAISKQYARLLGGDITVESTHGKGTTFLFTATLNQAAAPAEADLPSRAPGSVTRLATDQPEVRVLVVDDLATNRDLLVTLFARAGFICKIAENGAVAVDIFKSWRPQAVLMDMRMPVMDGYEASRRIKADPAGAHTRIYAITASAFEEDKSAVLAAGADDFIRKPFKADELLELIERDLHLKFAAPTEPVHAMENTRQPAAADIPEELRARILAACRAADFEALTSICDKIAEDSPPLAGELLRRLNSFDYDGIARYISHD